MRSRKNHAWTHPNGKRVDPLTASNDKGSHRLLIESILQSSTSIRDGSVIRGMVFGCSVSTCRALALSPLRPRGIRESKNPIFRNSILQKKDQKLKKKKKKKPSVFESQRTICIVSDGAAGL